MPINNSAADYPKAKVTMSISSTELHNLNEPDESTLGHVAPAPAEIRVLRTLPEVEEFRTAWMRLQRHPNADIDFYLQVLQSLPGPVRPHVLVACLNGTPVGFLVGRLENSRMDLKIGYAHLLRVRAHALTFIYGGLLGEAGAGTSEILALEVAKSLRQGEADFAFFNHLQADSPFYAALCRHAGVFSRDCFPVLQTHRTMTIPGNTEEFWERFSPKVRKNQRWQAKKLLADHPGGVRISCFQQTSELERMIQDVEEVAKKTYQRGLGVGFVDDCATRNRLHLRAENGWLRTFVLYVSDRPCAFWVGTLYKGTFHSDSMGYDPEYSKYSPGMYMVMRVIEDFCQKDAAGQVATIDFGLGDAQYKEILGNVQWQDVSVYLFGSTLRGLGLNMLRTPIILIDRLGRRVVEGANLLPRIKKLWRNALTRCKRGDSPLAPDKAGQPTRKGEKQEPVSAE